MTAPPRDKTSLSAIQRSFVANRLRSDSEIAPFLAGEPIAIVGMACRFPGGGDTPEKFWELLDEGRDAVTPPPAARFSPDELRAIAGDRFDALAGSFLERVDGFDSEFFRISRREASMLDPQQRLLLQVAWEAFERAGVRRLEGSKTGVFVGVGGSDYKLLLPQTFEFEDLDPYVSVGTDHCFASGRVSYTLGLRGPSLSLDTACSSSLLAVHLACASLRDRESDTALAAGVQLILTPHNLVLGANPIIADTRCRTFDSRAGGTVRGEGCGAVVLKRLSDALTSGDSVHAVIRGSSANQDGRSAGLTAPSMAAQKDVIRAALTNACLSPAEVDYIEAHGTATPLGDPIELQALIDVFGEPRTDSSQCAVGSVKTNLGHLEAAAGIAGLIKAVLAIEHARIPAHLHFEQLNPSVSFENTALAIPATPRSWPDRSGPRRAGVSAFGASGTNVHLVLEQAPEAATPEAGAVEQTELLALSARSEGALLELAARYEAALRPDGGLAEQALEAICGAAVLTRAAQPHRLAIPARSIAELRRSLGELRQGEPPRGHSEGEVRSAIERRLVFVFSGQESEWAGMGRELYVEQPVFREAIDEIDSEIRTCADWSLLDVLIGPDTEIRLGDIAISQPCVFAIQVALAALWRSWGVEPDAVVGQSMGEIAAATVAGAISVGDATRIVCARSRLGRSLRGQGKMAAVHLSMADAEIALRKYTGRASVAAENGPEAVLVAGEPGTIDELVGELEARGVYCKLLRADGASHSPLVERLRDAFCRDVGEIDARPADVPFISTVTGRFEEGSGLDTDYWARNARQPVLFWSAMRELVSRGHDLFLEVSPHPVGFTAIDASLRKLELEGAALYSLRKGAPERASLLETMGRLFTLGYRVDWNALYPRARPLPLLPTHPWIEEPFWYSQHPAAQPDPGWHPGGREETAGHPFLGRHYQPSNQKGAHLWEVPLSGSRLPYLRDHKSGNLTPFPGSAYVELALAAAVQCGASETTRIEDLAIESAMLIPETGSLALQTIAVEDSHGDLALHVQSRSDVDGGTWRRHATATLRTESKAEPAPEPISPATICESLPHHAGHTEFYAALRDAGQDYGPEFQRVQEAWYGEMEAFGRIALPPGDIRSRYRIHPCLLDGAFQLSSLALSHLSVGGFRSIYVPVGIRSIRASRVGDSCWARVRVVNHENLEDEIVADLELFGEAGESLALIRGLRLRNLVRPQERSVDDWLFATRWPAAALADVSPTEPRAWMLLEGDGASSALSAALADRLHEAGQHPVRVTTAATLVLDGDPLEGDPSNPDQLQALVEAVGTDAAPLAAILDLRALDDPAEGKREPWATALEATLRTAALSRALGRILGSPPRLWVATRGAAAVREGDRVQVEHASLRGLLRVVELEYPDLRASWLDLESGAPETRSMGPIAAEILADGPDTAIAFRGGIRHVERLVRHQADQGEPVPHALRPGEAFRLEIAERGIIDALRSARVDREAPLPGMLEIEVHAGALNFKDVLGVLDVIPALGAQGVLVGGDCAGVVTRIGEDVTEFGPGDRVVALTAGLASHSLTHEHLVARVPDSVDLATAAGIPSAFMTAIYALEHIGRLRAGERVLIHSATGGVGLAAIEIARSIGAEIWATAGTEAKRERLRNMGIEHVMDSRTLAFAPEILEATGGVGVDVVLNSLSGKALEANLEALAPYGRFLEIGIRDIYENRSLQLWPFHKNLSYHAIEIAPLASQKPELCRELLRDAMGRVERGEVASCPVTRYPISAAQDAFREMAQARHVGKLVLELDDPQLQLLPSVEPRFRFAGNGAVLITGGLGGLGILLARWLIEHGARSLVLTGRNGLDRPGAAEAVSELRALGAEIEVLAADVSQESDVREVLDAIHASGRFLRGVVHAAALLEDGLLETLDGGAFARAMAPKARGAWNLHAMTENEPLDFFVLFSSTSSLLGNVGQGNYAAGNSFMDGLAGHRRALGLPGVSISWGAWARVGGAALLQTDKTSTAAGFDSIEPELGLAAFERLVFSRTPHVGVMGLDPDRFFGLRPELRQHPLFAEIAGVGSGIIGSNHGGELRRELSAIEDRKERGRRLRAYLREEVAKTLRLDVGRIDPSRELFDYGIDSLSAVELRNRFERGLGIVGLSPTIMMVHPTLDAMAPILAQKAGIEAEFELAAHAQEQRTGGEPRDDARARSRRAHEARRKRRERAILQRREA